MATLYILIMFDKNFRNSKSMSHTAMHMTNNDAFVLRKRFFLITIIVRMLPVVPNISKIRRVISPKSHGLGVNLICDSSHVIFFVDI